MGSNMSAKEKAARENTITFSTYSKGKQEGSHFGHILQLLSAPRLYGTIFVTSTAN